MAIANNADISLSRTLRNLVRTAVTNHARWNDYRTNDLAGKLSRDLTTDDIKNAATALGIDIESIAEANGIDATTTESDDMPKTIALTDDNASGFEGRDVTDVINAALMPAQGLLGSTVLDVIAKAIRPLAAAATAGPRTITRDVVRNVPVHVGATDNATRFVDFLKASTARDVFSIKAAEAGAWRNVLDKPINVYNGTALEGVPSIDEFHVFDTEALAYICMAANLADSGHRLRAMSRTLIVGAAGTGKTSMVQQFAAHTGRPFTRVAFDRSTEPAELIGQRMPKAGGGTEFRAGALVTAMQVPYNVILLDEPSFLRPGAAAVLQTLLDTGVVFLKEDGNRRIEMAPGVIVCAADNTNLTGDETGRYADTQAQNIALQDRFAFIVKVDYLPEAREANLLVQRTGVPIDAARAMVNFATLTRGNAKSGQLTSGCSLRRLIAWATAVQAGVPSEKAFEAAIINGADAADRQTLKGLEGNCAPHHSIDNAINGKPVSPISRTAPNAGNTSTPQGARAANAFANNPVTV